MPGRIYFFIAILISHMIAYQNICTQTLVSLVIDVKIPRLIEPSYVSVYVLPISSIRVDQKDGTVANIIVGGPAKVILGVGILGVEPSQAWVIKPCSVIIPTYASFLMFPWLLTTPKTAVSKNFNCT